MDISQINNPLVSVIIPCYNAEKYVGQAIESVLNQIYKNFEIIIISDGSTDSSENVVKNYLALDERIKLFTQTNKGVALTRNRGVEISKGAIIAFLDADDAWEPENLDVKVKALTSDPKLFWVFSDVYLADEKLDRAP